jgi:hypothetical protein
MPHVGPHPGASRDLARPKSEPADLTFYVSGGINPVVLMPDQRALLLLHCNDHPVAVCPGCGEALPFERLGADIIMGKRDFCPMCRADLTTAVLQHLAECTVTRARGRASRQRAARHVEAEPRGLRQAERAS